MDQLGDNTPIESQAQTLFPLHGDVQEVYSLDRRTLGFKIGNSGLRVNYLPTTNSILQLYRGVLKPSEVATPYLWGCHFTPNEDLNWVKGKEIEYVSLYNFGMEKLLNQFTNSTLKDFEKFRSRFIIGTTNERMNAMMENLYNKSGKSYKSHQDDIDPTQYRCSIDLEDVLQRNPEALERIKRIAKKAETQGIKMEIR